MQSAIPTPAPGIKPTPIAAQQLLEDGEQVLMVVRKSILVLIGLYLEVLLAVAGFVGLLLVIRPTSLDELISSQSASSLIAAVLAVALVVFVLVLVTFIYLENELVITTRSLIQVTQRGPFSHKAARLSFSNVEDVSANISGLLASIFNYGSLLVQTAGAMDNFNFTYCPDPNHFAHEILEARQAYAEALKEANETP